jgi:hypothetical protein
MTPSQALKLEAETPALPPSFAMVRDAANAITDSSPAPFQRALLLLRGTRSRIVLCQVNFWGQVSEECGVLLYRLFGQDAMIEKTDDSTYIMLFVRRRDDETCVEGKVMNRLAQSMQPAFGRRFHATMTSMGHNSETVGDFEDLLAQLAVEESKGAKIVTI